MVYPHIFDNLKFLPSNMVVLIMETENLVYAKLSTVKYGKICIGYLYI